MKKSFNFKLKQSFTFIETLVVIALFGLILPLVLTMLFTILRQQLRIFALSEVKRQGDYIVSFLDGTIRENAYRLYDFSGSEICDESSVSPFPHEGEPSTFHDKFNSIFSIDYTYPNLTFNYPSQVFPAPTFSFPQGLLNSSRVLIESYAISCIRSSEYSAPLISINFTICFNRDGNCSASNTSDIISLNY